MFENRVGMLEFIFDNYDPYHNFEFWNAPLPGKMTICMFCVFVCVYVLMARVLLHHNSIIENFKKKAFVELPTYFKTLSGMDQKRWYTHLLHMEHALGIKKADSHLKDQLRTT